MRVTRTIADRGGKSILPYTAEDLTAPATALADEAYALPAGSGYTDAQAILELAKSTGAQAIHPGYGFLSENAKFSKICAEHGIKFIGASPEMIEKMGDKAVEEKEQPTTSQLDSIMEGVASAFTKFSAESDQTDEAIQTILKRTKTMV